MGKPQRARYTWEDYLKFPDDGNRYEILDGDLFVTPSPVTGHQYTSAELFLVLSNWSRSRAGGRVFYAPLTVKLAEDTVVEPDLMWISPEREVEILGDDWLYGIPDLVVEIQSPSTARRDRLRKSDVYARFGAREYWLADPKDESFEIRKLEGDHFVRHALGTGEVELVSSLDEALRIVPARLFDPILRPRKR